MTPEAVPQIQLSSYSFFFFFFGSFARMSILVEQQQALHSP